MKRKAVILTAIFLAGILVTPVLAGNGKRNGGSNNHSRLNNEISVDTRTMQKSQVRQQSQYRYQKNTATETVTSQTSNQFRMEKQLSNSADTVVEATPSTL